jgi:hypothetical protein
MVSRRVSTFLRFDVGGLARAIAIVAGFSSALVGNMVGMAVAISEAERPKALKNQAP